MCAPQFRYDPARGAAFVGCWDLSHLVGFLVKRFWLVCRGRDVCFPRQLDAMGVVNKAIEDGVGVSGVANSRMPSRHGKLRGDDRRPAPIAVFEDFQESWREPASRGSRPKSSRIKRSARPRDFKRRG